MRNVSKNSWDSFSFFSRRYFFSINPKYSLLLFSLFWMNGPQTVSGSRARTRSSHASSHQPSALWCDGRIILRRSSLRQDRDENTHEKRVVQKSDGFVVWHKTAWYFLNPLSTCVLIIPFFPYFLKTVWFLNPHQNRRLVFEPSSKPSSIVLEPTISLWRRTKKKGETKKKASSHNKKKEKDTTQKRRWLLVYTLVFYIYI